MTTHLATGLGVGREGPGGVFDPGIRLNVKVGESAPSDLPRTLNWPLIREPGLTQTSASSSRGIPLLLLHVATSPDLLQFLRKMLNVFLTTVL